MNKIKEYFNGYANMFTVIVIIAGIITSALDHNLITGLLWFIVLGDSARCISLEKTRDMQHEVIVSQRDRISKLEKTIAELNATK